ncbi:acyl-CoA thioesterase domain-containing protein, partial [Arthrobacter sp. GCM10027362]|uniref:acyl-CoA thioesterase domain-containing protein n=1 Tax=Arthrobacter sp. GCM10027362 TaxID=3273379 RepID=UPI0036414F2E
MPESLTTATEHLGAAGEPVPDAYYVRRDAHRFHSTLHSQGAWNDHEQHMAPASGLLIHEVLRNHPRPDMVISQATFEILGVIPGGAFEVHTEVVRPGRTIELIEATLSGNGRPAVRALIWRLLTGDTSEVAGGPGGRL